jgi:hypothetical protein
VRRLILGPILLIIRTVLLLLIYPIPTWIVLADPPRQESKQIIKMNLLWGLDSAWMGILSRVGLFRTQTIPLTPMARTRTSIEKIRAELVWVNQPLDPNKCSCRHMRSENSNLQNIDGFLPLMAVSRC